MLRYVLVSLLIFSSSAYAHEMVPTYPKLVPSLYDGLSKTTMTMFNKRSDVEYYEIGVFTADWEPIPFVSTFKVFKIPYLDTVTFDVYVRNKDKSKVTYICSRSKLLKEDLKRTSVTSRICSKVK